MRYPGWGRSRGTCRWTSVTNGRCSGMGRCSPPGRRPLVRSRPGELLPVWWTPRLGCFTRLEGADGTATVQPGVQAGGSSAGPGAWGFGGAGQPRFGRGRESVPALAKEFSSAPGQAFPGQGQLKLEQQEIERLRREIAPSTPSNIGLAAWLSSRRPSFCGTRSTSAAQSTHCAAVAR